MPQYYTSSSGSFAEFVESEHIIDPYSYNNSRRLRRQIRRLRYEYLQQQTRNNPFRLTSKERRDMRRQQRRETRIALDNARNQYNNSSRTLEEDIFYFDFDA